MIIFSILIQLMPLGAPPLSLDVEIADNENSRRIGLGGRSGIGESEGMLFIFDAPQRVSFWMRGVDFPIDIGFFDQEGLLCQIEAMAPSPPPYASHRSKGKTLYALEVAAGWFERNKVGIGAEISLPAR